MNAAPAGARRGRIYAPLVYPSTVCGKGGMNAAPTIIVGGAFMRPWFIHRPFATRAA